MPKTADSSARAARSTLPPGGGLAATVWRRPFLRASWLALFVSGIGVSSTMPQITLFLVDELHLSIAVAGLYFLVNVVAPVAGFALGSLSDRLPDRLILFRVCALLGALGWAGMAFATAPWVPFVIGGTVLSVGGAAMGLLFAAVRDDLTRHPTRNDSGVIAALRMAFSAGWIIGPVLGSWFGANYGLRPLLLATAGCVLLQMLPLGLRRVERVGQAAPSLDDHSGVGDPAPRAATLAPLLIFLTCCVLVMNGDTMKFAYLPLYMDNQLHFGDLERGAVIAIQPLLELVLMPIFALLAVRTSAIRIITVGAVLGVGAHVAYATSASLVGLLIGQVLMAGLWAAIAGLGITVAQQLAPHRIGLASTMFTSCIPLGGALGGTLGALGTVWLGIPHLFAIPAVLTLLGGVGLVFTARRYRPDDSAFSRSSRT